MNNTQDIKAHSFSETDKYFLDANIWLYVYGPIAFRNKKSATYSKALFELRNVGCLIFIDVLIVSEFINTYARFEHKQSQRREINFKEFRKTSTFSEISKDITNNTKRIIKQCQRCNLNFVDIDIEGLLSKFEKGDSDFNDQVFSEICKINGYILITDDADFDCEDLNILTANQRLLNK